ncbi:MAG TPA: hypothetical protein DCM28_20975 [Phycisphaerales bacterium]|nr:hypothetical protein [Phycisphaerales bacterium]|tara:strand:+ start:156 stop:404 length:249 start_codon:yes stop_codon:yes gene_type:complete
MPEVISLDELNAHLLACCRKDLQLPGAKPQHEQLRATLLNEERIAMLALPETAFEACELIDTQIDKRSLVTVKTNCYSAPVR